MPQLLCPVCGLPLTRTENTLRCGVGHSFDYARQGYVNLLPVSQKHSLHPGDTREQVASRRAFLDAGFYAPIAEKVTGILRAEAPRSVLDVGCGEGYYLSSALRQLPDCEGWGMDISKDAVRYAAVRCKTAGWFVGTASHLPFADGSFDCVVSMFALTLPEEFRRVLRPGGLFLQVTAHREHLMNLRRIIYPEITKKEDTLSSELPGFAPDGREELVFDFTLTKPEQVAQLLGMTPHFWRITKEGALRAAQTQTLSDTAKIVFQRFRAE